MDHSWLASSWQDQVFLLEIPAPGDLLVNTGPWNGVHQIRHSRFAIAGNLPFHQTDCSYAGTGFCKQYVGEKILYFS